MQLFKIFEAHARFTASCNNTAAEFWSPSAPLSLLNRFRTEQGHCGACRRKLRLADTDLCPSGETQTMSYIVKSCLLTKLNGSLSRLHSADEDAVSWLTNYGSWHAYEKQKTAAWNTLLLYDAWLPPLAVFQHKIHILITVWVLYLPARQCSYTPTCETISRLQWETPAFISPDTWLPNSPDLNPLSPDCISIVRKFRKLNWSSIYARCLARGLEQSGINDAIHEWCKCLRVCTVHSCQRRTLILRTCFDWRAHELREASEKRRQMGEC